MKKRSLAVKRYAIAGLITFLVFVLGLLLGLVLDYERVDYLESKYSQHELDYRSLQMQFAFLDDSEHDGNSCAAFEKAMEQTVAELSDSLEEVERYKEYSTTKKGSYSDIERRYILDNLRYWMIVENALDICPMQRMTILYFYSAEECSTCPDQGVILTYYKRRFGDNLLIFPINTDISEVEPFISVIQSKYNVTRYPSLVIEGRTFTGVVSKERLGPMVCRGLGLDEEECV